MNYSKESGFYPRKPEEKDESGFEVEEEHIRVLESQLNNIKIERIRVMDTLAVLEEKLHKVTTGEDKEGIQERIEKWQAEAVNLEESTMHLERELSKVKKRLEYLNTLVRDPQGDA